MRHFFGFVCIVALAACGKGDKSSDKAGSASGGGGSSKPPPAKVDKDPAPTPVEKEPPKDPVKDPAPPAADDGCEYTVDGGEPQRGKGGLSNVQSLHWMPKDQKGRSLASWLLINCGPVLKQVNIVPSNKIKDGEVPMAPKKYVIGKADNDGGFAVIGPDFIVATGELDVTAFDTSHVAGTFKFEAKGKKYAGKFDLKCPTPGNGICTK